MNTCDFVGCAGHLGKFPDCVTEALFASDADESTGSSDFEGFYGLYVITEPVSLPIDGTTDGVLVPVSAGFYVVHESGTGFVTTSEYDTESEARKVFMAADARYAEWSRDDIDDDDTESGDDEQDAPEARPSRRFQGYRWHACVDETIPGLVIRRVYVGGPCKKHLPLTDADYAGRTIGRVWKSGPRSWAASPLRLDGLPDDWRSEIDRSERVFRTMAEACGFLAGFDRAMRIMTRGYIPRLSPIGDPMASARPAGWVREASA